MRDTMGKFRDLLEGKSDYIIYHNSYSDAISEMINYIHKNGYVYNEDEFFNTVTTGPGKPKGGNTHRFSLQMFKGDKETRKYIQVQIYNRETNTNRFELNMYIS